MPTASRPSATPQLPPGVRRILICRTDNIGDVVLTLPLAGYIKQTWPQIEVGFLVRAYAAPVVRLSAAVDCVLARETAEAEHLLAGWDMVIFAFPDKQLARAAKRARVPWRVGSSHRLYHWLYCNRRAHFSRVKSDWHEAQLNFKLLTPFGIDLQPSVADLIAWGGLQAPPREQVKDWLDQRTCFVLHPKSNGNGREWPIARFVELVRAFAADAQVSFVLTGSKAEGEWLAQAAPELFKSANVRNACGKLDLQQLAALIAHADGLVASGTGPLHMAAALGQRCLGLFPPIAPIHIARWGAVGARAQNLSAASRCDSCNGAQSCCCMAQISAEQVAQVLAGWRQQAA
ncbi:glycosyltransferase family 9 protein [Massilia sp. W12]|uniref:glycosyltransferase family 9 protein n=1 Tax=Massilia sp. W12 TaxID=3126507 RepID=UPI0030D3D6F3